MTNDKLAEALRNARSFVSLFHDDPAQACLAEIDEALQAHAAEAAQAQAQSGTTLTAEEVSRIAGRLDPSGVTTDLVGIAQARGALNAFATMLAAAPQQAAEPVAITKDSDDLYTGWLSWTGKEFPPGTKLYTRPQPAQDAKDWTDAQCIEFMQVGLRNVQYASVRGAGPTVDEIRQGVRAAMAKEST